MILWSGCSKLVNTRICHWVCTETKGQVAVNAPWSGPT